MEIIGNYQLNQNYREVANELTECDKKMFKILGKTFSDERLFLGKNIKFLNHIWTTMIATTKNKIYKISLQNEDLSINEEEFDSDLFNEVINYFNKSYKLSEIKDDNMYFYDTDWGNLIIHHYLGNSININFTSGEPFDSQNISKKIISFILFSISFYIIQPIKKSILYNPIFHSNQDNLQWSWLRSIEWGSLPLYFSQLFVPILLLFIHWYYLIMIVIILCWFWSLFRYKIINMTIASISGYIVIIKWIISICMAIIFIFQGNWFNAIFSAIYPIIVYGLIIFVPRTKIGKMQEIFMNKIGYSKNKDN